MNSRAASAIHCLGFIFVVFCGSWWGSDWSMLVTSMDMATAAKFLPSKHARRRHHSPTGISWLCWCKVHPSHEATSLQPTRDPTFFSSQYVSSCIAPCMEVAHLQWHSQILSRLAMGNVFKVCNGQKNENILWAGIDVWGYSKFKYDACTKSCMSLLHLLPTLLVFT
jgi:hypothetical protein